MEKLDCESRKKRFKRSDEHIGKMMDIVKSQCGSHSVKSMAEMLKMPKATVLNKIKQLGIVFSKREGECHFCDLKKSITENSEPKDKGYDSSLYSCLRYDKVEKMFSCSVCNRQSHYREVPR